jgi:hypothetical protein
LIDLHSHILPGLEDERRAWPAIRAVGTSDVAAALEDDALARWLTVEVPTAIVGGGALPERPAGRRRRLRLRFG